MPITLTDTGMFVVGRETTGQALTFKGYDEEQSSDNQYKISYNFLLSHASYSSENPSPSINPETSSSSIFLF